MKYFPFCGEATDQIDNIKQGFKMTPSPYGNISQYSSTLIFLS